MSSVSRSSTGAFFIRNNPISESLYCGLVIDFPSSDCFSYLFFLRFLFFPVRPVKPECSVTLREADGKTKLICEVKANPEKVDFLWVSRNSTLTKNTVQLGLQSVLTIDDPAQTTGTFSCYANNSAGFSTPCEINVESKTLFNFSIPFINVNTSLTNRRPVRIIRR